VIHMMHHCLQPHSLHSPTAGHHPLLLSLIHQTLQPPAPPRCAPLDSGALDTRRPQVGLCLCLCLSLSLGRQPGPLSHSEPGLGPGLS
jgi:hypothetical protein